VACEETQDRDPNKKPVLRATTVLFHDPISTDSAPKSQAKSEGSDVNPLRLRLNYGVSTVLAEM